MTNHRIIAADWQLKAAQDKRLVIVLLDFVGKIDAENMTTALWKLSKRHEYQIGDRLYLSEKWRCDDTHDMYFVESTTPEAEHIGWEPAETMPEEAAVHWYEVTGVRVCQINQLTFQDATWAGCKCFPLSGSKGYGKEKIGIEELKDYWNAAWPEYPWHGDRWVVVLGIKEVKNA